MFEYNNLMRRERQALDFIINYKIAMNGLSPSRQEIANATDLNSVAGVTVSLNRLESYGFILITPLQRGIVIVDSVWQPPNWYLERMKNLEGK